jgi:hypothetical protein
MDFERPTLVALVALVYAYRNGTVWGADVAATILPMLAFVTVAATREEIQAGWAMLLWPVVVGMFSMYLVAAKLLLVQRFVAVSRTASNLLLGTLVLGAAALGLTVPQLLE